jgi:hydroxymethylcytosylglucuronate/cytosylglucuronate synthase
MRAHGTGRLLVAICDFGWGSMGKLRLILDKLPGTRVSFYGTSGIYEIAAELLASRHTFDEARHHPSVALVINDPKAANEIGGRGIPAIYVDSLPYLWAKEDEVPRPENLAYYCAQRFPADRLPIAPVLRERPIHWIDPIVPARGRRAGGHGTIVNFGGLHSHLTGSASDAYVRLVLPSLLTALKERGDCILAVCGNLSEQMRQEVRQRAPECSAVGPQTPYDFESLLQSADLLITSPGSTTILQAIFLQLPALLLPPQNLSQILNARLFSSPSASPIQWPSCVMPFETIEKLRTQGEDAVLTYMYQSISDAALSTTAAAEVARGIATGLQEMPAEGVLDLRLSALGNNGASQVAQLIKQAMLAPIRLQRGAGSGLS